jgi:hypothetical protein
VPPSPGSGDGEPYEFYFSSDESGIRTIASAWTSHMSRHDMETARRISADSRRAALKEKAPLVLGVPLALFAAGLLVHFLPLAFRPRPRVGAR